MVNPFYSHRGWGYRVAQAARVRVQRLWARRARSRGLVCVVPIVDTEGPGTGSPTDLSSWEAVDAQVAQVMEEGFRGLLLDSAGQSVKLSWFLEDASGCRDPQKRATAPFEVLDHYRQVWGTQLGERGDGLFWHYHHYPPSGEFRPDPDWSTHRRYDDLLTRLILERQFCPGAIRTGWTSSSNVFGQWLDTVVPFDFSSRAPYWFPGVADWSRAPTSWRPYQPSASDYQRPGTLSHSIFRALDADNPRWCTRWELEKAFVAAAAGQVTCLAFFSHDYKDMAAHFAGVLQEIARIARRYPGVAWRHATATEAARLAVGAPELPPLELRVEKGQQITAFANNPLFGGSPWLAVRSATGEYHRFPGEPAGSAPDLSWHWSLPKDAQAAAISAVDVTGQSQVVTVPL